MHNHTLFLTLNVFSATGGIEKVCRIAGKALYENSVQCNQRMMVWSMHDGAHAAMDNPYFPTEIFRSFAGKKLAFVKESVQQGIQSKLVILSHINLLMVGWMIKKLSPATRVVMMAHGIEVWSRLPNKQRMMLAAVDQVWAVSNFTRAKIIEQQGLGPDKVSVLNNCLDPFMVDSKNVKVSAELKTRYGIGEKDKVLFTLTRLSSKEKYKGYADVIDALQLIDDSSIKYIIAGKADETELVFVKDKIAKAGLQNNVILAGFIADEEVAAHYKMSDCFVMPSSGEGFGVAFIEAMFYGTPVIGGNADGSMDAMKNGELGMPVTPGNIKVISNAIQKVIQQKELPLPKKIKLMEQFGYPNYKLKLSDLMGYSKLN